MQVLALPVCLRASPSRLPPPPRCRPAPLRARTWCGSPFLRTLMQTPWERRCRNLDTLCNWLVSLPCACSPYRLCQPAGQLEIRHACALLGNPQIAALNAIVYLIVSAECGCPRPSVGFRRCLRQELEHIRGTSLCLVKQKCAIIERCGCCCHAPFMVSGVKSSCGLGYAVCVQLPLVLRTALRCIVMGGERRHCANRHEYRKPIAADTITTCAN